MNIFFLLLKRKILHLSKVFQKGNWPQILVILVMVFIALVLMIVTFLFSYQSFAFLKRFPAFLKPLSFYTLSASFFLISILSFLSSLISSFKTLFEPEDNNLLLSLPISFIDIAKTRFLDNLFLSSWPIVVFGLPLLASFALTFRFSTVQFLVSFAALLLLLFAVNLISCFLGLLIVLSFGNLGKKFLLALLTVLVPLSSYLVAQILVPEDLKSTFAKLEVVKIQDFFESLPLTSRFLPSTWVVNAVFFIDQSLSFSALNFFWLLIFTAVSSILVFDFFGQFYFKALGKSLVGKFVAGPWDKTNRFLKKKFPYILRGKTGALWEREILCSLRDQQAVFQGIFIIFLSFLYFFLLSKVPLSNLKAVLPNYSLQTLLNFNFLVSAYLLTILCLRFVFPSFSAEGQSAWVIFSSPIKREKIFREKFTLFWIFLTFLGVILSLASGIIFRLPFPSVLSQALLFVPLCLALAGISLGLGCIFPNFSETNLEKLSTSPGGIIAIASSLAYIGVVSILTVLFGEQLFLLAYLSVWGLSISLFSIIYFFALKKINMIEF